MKSISPCRSCQIHLSGGNKNGQACGECQKRISYVLALGWDGISPAHPPTYLDSMQEVQVPSPATIPARPEKQRKARKMAAKGHVCQGINAKTKKPCERPASSKKLCRQCYQLRRYHAKRSTKTLWNLLRQTR